MGAKASSVLVQTPDIKILVDPGTAEMQGSYPLPDSDKRRLRHKALQAIVGAAKTADTIFISHYHYDHHTLPQEAPELYQGKRLWIKDPNRWICRSQWQRARIFLGQICMSRGEALESICRQPERIEAGDPFDELPLASRKDYGDYRQRKEELSRKGKAKFGQLVEFWQTNPWVEEAAIGDNEVLFVDGREIEAGSTRIRFTKPLFHGLEYTPLGWVIGLVVECGGAKVLYTSDLQGPTIEDYAQWVIDENPSIIIADGPATYLFGYTVNRVNLERGIENMCRILRQTSAEIIIYDHHLLREPRFRERTSRAWEVADRAGKRLITAAEQLGEEPLVLKLGGG
ncbi:MAG TPA: MBL fold metallo-hydrolase [Dehalococcoidia bacterium]|nr:MBL fold metallo-hydrolase [Dehalococcoidia bacterium]